MAIFNCFLWVHQRVPCFFMFVFFWCKLKVCGSWFRASTLCGWRRGWARRCWIWLDLTGFWWIYRWSAGWNHHLHQVLQDQAQQWVWWLPGVKNMGTWSTSHFRISQNLSDLVKRSINLPFLRGCLVRGHPLFFLKWRQFWTDILCTVYLPWPSTSSISEQRNRRGSGGSGYRNGQRRRPSLPQRRLSGLEEI